MKIARVEFKHSINKWILLSGSFLMFAFIVYYFVFFQLIEAIVCPVRTITGFPCLTCGGTAMVFHTMHGDFGQAFNSNPLLFLAGVIAVILYISIVILTLSKIHFKVEFSHKELVIFRSFIVAILIINWIYLYRNY